MAANWGTFRITGEGLTDAEKNFNYLMDNFGPEHGYNFAFQRYFSNMGGSGGKFWQGLISAFGEAVAHQIANTFSGGGSNQSGGAFKGYRPGYRPPELLIPDPPRPPRTRSTLGRRG